MVPLIWVDVETTGLDPEEDRLLEVSMVATDEAMAVQDSLSAAVFLPPADRADLAPAIVSMHGKNGLLARCWDRRQSFEAEKLDGLFLPLVTRYEGRPAAGSSPWFDVAFLRKWMPRTAGKLDRHMFDVTTLAMFFGVHRLWGGIHRSLPDLWRDLELTHRLLSGAQLNNLPAPTKALEPLPPAPVDDLPAAS